MSVGVPVYNGERYLEGCLRSLTSQTLDDIEIVVADNASTDRSVEIVRDLAADDQRIRLLGSPENRGAAWNYNRLVDATSAPYFCWTPHDDERTPDALARCHAALEGAGPDTVLAYTQGVFIDAAGTVTAPDTDTFLLPYARPAVRLARALQQLNLASPILGVIRRDALEASRRIDTFAGSDYVLLCELAMLGRSVEVAGVGFRRRMHSHSSRAAARSRDEVQAWFDPRGRVSRLSDRSRLLVEYHRSAARLPMSPFDRALCVAVIAPARTYRRARVAAGAARDRVRGTTVHEEVDE